MQQSSVDLASVFQSVTQALAQNQQALNQADPYNQDHGSNMVQTFQTITSALEKKKGSTDSAALAYASKQLAKNTTSSSGQLYAQNLAQAADQFQGRSIDSRGALELLQTLIGGQSAAQPASGDLLGALLGGTGGGTVQPRQPAGAQGGEDLLGALLGGLGGGMAQQQPQQAGGDMLGELLGGLTGGSGSGGTPAQTGGGLQDGLGLDDLLNAGMAYMQARQSGGSNTQALVQALLAGSGMGNTDHRQQSTALVVNTFLQALGSLGKRS